MHEGAVLTHDELLRIIREGILYIEPFDESIVRENGLELRIGNEYAMYKVEDMPIDPCQYESMLDLFVVKKVDSGYIEIPPRSFVLLTTLEYIRLPLDLVGLCNLRSTFARIGLSIPPTVVDAGFEGNLTIEVINNSPNIIRLKPGVRFLHLVLLRAVKPALYSGKYKGQRGVTPPKGLKHECPS